MSIFKGVIAGLMVSPHDPIYFFGLRRVKWAATPDARRQYQFFVFVLLFALIFAVWLGLADWLITVFDMSNSVELAAWVFAVTFGGGVFLNLFLDFGSLLFAVSSINGERLSGRWDLLRLSLLAEADVIQAKYALAQVRAWRVMVFVRGMRAVALVVFLLLLFVIPYLGGETDSLWRDLSDFVNESPYESFVSLTIVIAFWGYYLFDPVWRLRALTAIGLAISARTHSVIFAILAAFGALLCMWIVQAALAGVFFWVLFLLLRDNTIESEAIGLTLWLFAQLVFASIMYLFYRGVRDFALDKTLLWAFRE